jgi:serine/threonine protein kinase
VSWVPKIDTQFGQYHIQEHIGHGGMSVVYRAQHVSLARNVALKILSPALTDDEAFRERFIRESRMAAALDHPNIIPIYEAGELDGVFFIAMRYVDGPDLHELLHEHGPFDVERSLSIVSQVASALSVAHDQGLVHRDVKPANVLVSAIRNGEEADHVYLSDFGVAKQTASNVALTKTGMFVGTVYYASPEQIEGYPLDGRSDIYSLGCVLYECLTAEMPYERDSEVAMLYAHLLEPPPRVTEKRPDLTTGFDEVIAKAMAKSRDDRYDTSREFAAAARTELGKLVASRAAPPPAPPAEGADAIREDREVIARETVAAQPPLVPARQPDVPSADVPSEPEPVRAPPAPQREEGGTRRSWMQWLTLALLAILAAGVVALAAVLATDDDSASTPDSGRQTLVGGGTPTGSTSRIADVVPAAIFGDCAIKAVPLAGASQSAVCLGGSTRAFSPDRWEVSIFKDATALRAAYEAERRRANASPDSGRCDGTSWGGEGPWVHGRDRPGGRRFCYFDGDDAVMVWTHERLGQETHADALGIAREGGTDHPRLFNWWRFWHHRIGRLND